MSPIFLTMGPPAIACIALISVAAMRLSQLGDHLVRQEAKLNLILGKMEIAFPAAAFRGHPGACPDAGGSPPSRPTARKPGLA